MITPSHILSTFHKQKMISKWTTEVKSERVDDTNHDNKRREKRWKFLLEFVLRIKTVNKLWNIGNYALSGRIYYCGFVFVFGFELNVDSAFHETLYKFIVFMELENTIIFACLYSMFFVILSPYILYIYPSILFLVPDSLHKYNSSFSLSVDKRNNFLHDGERKVEKCSKNREMRKAEG